MSDTQDADRLAALEARLAAVEARLAARDARLAALEARLSAREQKPRRSPRPATARPPRSPQPTRGTAADVLATLATLGGSATVAQLREQLPHRAHSSIRRTCQELRNAGRLEQLDVGMYGLIAKEG